MITPSTIKNAMSYLTYVQYVKERYHQGQCTDHHTDEDYLNYTKMSISRMDRLDRKAQILPEIIKQIQAITLPQIWLTLSEGWCADAAQSLPYLEKMAQLNPLIELKVLLREQHPDIMDQHLTNGTRSIPKVIILESQQWNVLGVWGPRPLTAQAIVDKAKSDKIGIHDAAIKALIDYEKNKALQIWYKKDKGQSIQMELTRILDAIPQSTKK